MFKHLFKCTVHEGLPDMRKQLVPNYLKTAGFYSYDAPSVDEDPTAHWIGREVAAAPADVSMEMNDCTNAEGEQEMAYNDEYAPTEEELEQEEREEPLMMRNAARWDNFLAL
eukprot:368640-Prymnesium_polylepis.1